MKWLRLLIVFLVWWAIPTTPDVFDAQSAQIRNITLLASGAQTGNGATAVRGAIVDISACATAPTGNLPYDLVQVQVTAGSGTVTNFKVWIEFTGDGVNWAPGVPVGSVSAVSNPVSARHLLMDEPAVVTSGVASGSYWIPLTNARAAWIVNGSSPSETFSVTLSCYS